MQDSLASMATSLHRRQHQPLIGEAEISRFMTSALLRLAALIFAVALTAHTAVSVTSIQNKGDQAGGSDTTTSVESRQ